MAKHQKSHTSLSHLYILVLAIALGIGLDLPQYGQYLFPYTTFFLGCIFFFSSLRLHIRDVKETTHTIKTILFATVFKLIILPVLVYYVTYLIAPPLALPFLILAAMPTAMTAPLFTSMVYGKINFSLVLSITTSILAPITIPLIMKLLVGSNVSIDLLSMAGKLALIIILPIGLAEIIKYTQPKIAKKLTHAARPGSLTALGLLLIGVIATHAATVIHTLTTEPWKYGIPLIIFFILTHLLGYITFFWLPFKKRIAGTVSIAYMNFMLAIYLATTFFPEEHILIPIIISAIPWSIAIIPFAEITARHEHA